MGQWGPEARAGRASAVSRVRSRASARATYTASWKVTLSRSSQQRASSDTAGARSRGSSARSVSASRADLEVDQVQCRQRLSAEPAPGEIAVRSVIGQCGDEESGVNDDHGRRVSQRWLRPAEPNLRPARRRGRAPRPRSGGLLILDEPTAQVLPQGPVRGSSPPTQLGAGPATSTTSGTCAPSPDRRGGCAARSSRRRLLRSRARPFRDATALRTVDRVRSFLR